MAIRSRLEPALHDYQTPEFKAMVGAGETEDLQFEIVRSQGWLVKQNNVAFEATEDLQAWKR